jgi:hypothetical protein
MQACRNGLGTEDTTLVLSPDGDFFRFVGDNPGGGNTAKPSDSYSRKGLTLWQKGSSKFHKAT